MNFTKTILNGVKHWAENKFSEVEDKFSEVEKDLAKKQPVGDYALKSDIPVTSVNGQEGDVYLSYEDLKNQPFGIVEYWENYLLENEVINSDVVELDIEALKGNFRYDIAIEDANGNREYISDFANQRLYTGYKDPITGESISSLIEVGGEDGLIMPDEGFYLVSYRLQSTNTWTKPRIVIDTNKFTLPITIQYLAIWEEQIKFLDEKFIPNTIARKSDIPEVPVTSVNGQTGDVILDIPSQIQSDWDQSDQTALDYIKNRICYTTKRIETTVDTPEEGEIYKLWDFQKNAYRTFVTRENIVKRPGEKLEGSTASQGFLFYLGRFFTDVPENIYDNGVYGCDALRSYDLISIGDQNYKVNLPNMTYYFVFDIATLDEEYNMLFSEYGLYVQPNKEGNYQQIPSYAMFRAFLVTRIKDWFIPETVARVENVEKVTMTEQEIDTLLLKLTNEGGELSE